MRYNPDPAEWTMARLRHKFPSFFKQHGGLWSRRLWSGPGGIFFYLLSKEQSPVWDGLPNGQRGNAKHAYICRFHPRFAFPENLYKIRRDSVFEWMPLLASGHRTVTQLLARKSHIPADSSVRQPPTLQPHRGQPPPVGE